MRPPWEQGTQGVPNDIENGTIREAEGNTTVYYDGYWIRYYAPPRDTLAAKKHLIDVLKKRLFHHAEPGINTPGEKLEVARCAYERERDPARKRVNGAMLAGALFNRATDIFTTIVELEAKGVKLSPDNELMKKCGAYFQEALELGKAVKHYSGHEGVDELWGEPLKAFALPIEHFYESRYVKIAQAMRDVDAIIAKMLEVFATDPAFDGIAPLIVAFGETAKREAETVRSDPVNFEVWPRFVCAGEALLQFEQVERASPGSDAAQRLLEDGQALIGYVAGVRTPMPKSTREYMQRCDEFLSRHPRDRSDA